MQCGRYDPNVLGMFDFRASTVVKRFEDSLHKLRLPYVDVLQVHDLEFCPDPRIILEETLPALQKVAGGQGLRADALQLKEAGKIRYIGITGGRRRGLSRVTMVAGYDLDALCHVMEHSTVQIDTVLSYCRLVLHDRSLLSYLDRFAAKKVGVINASPISMGLLTPRGPPSWHPAGAHARAVCSKFVKVGCPQQRAGDEAVVRGGGRRPNSPGVPLRDAGGRPGGHADHDVLLRVTGKPEEEHFLREHAAVGQGGGRACIGGSGGRAMRR